MLRLTLAIVHLLALGIGLGAIWSRAAALREVPLTLGSARRAFHADAWWGIAALLWLASGIWRLLAGTEKATVYYGANHIFWAKMGLFALVLVLEVWPMLTLIRWRVTASRLGARWTPDPAGARRIALISYAEAVLVIGMVVAAVAVSRGYGTVG